GPSAVRSIRAPREIASILDENAPTMPPSTPAAPRGPMSGMIRKGQNRANATTIRESSAMAKKDRGTAGLMLEAFTIPDRPGRGPHQKRTRPPRVHPLILREEAMSLWTGVVREPRRRRCNVRRPWHVRRPGFVLARPALP